ncbi:tellurite resistance TerB family protein [Amorphus coralli]|uniref:tellurite resistance TerB family protein n=1 Tax=Amorphus coralli TaxID=340680 RepID=UPI000377504B|nr:tellurite resistance TerB family protein [Amorphus coralli]
MFDTRKLLDQFLGAGGLQGMAGSNQLPQSGHGGQTPARQGSPSLEGVPGGDMLGRVLNSGAFGGAAAGGLVTLLLTNKKSRKMAGSLVKYGALAAVGGLAYKAYSDWQSGKSAGQTQAEAAAGTLPPPQNTGFEGGATPEAQSELSLALLRAMIAAAKADGHIDADEQQRIFGFLDQVDLDAEAKAFVMDELRAPLDVDAVAKAATSPEIAAELYAASLLVIDEQNQAEKGYLAMLAARLNLPEDLVAHLHASVAGATGPAGADA